MNRTREPELQLKQPDWCGWNQSYRKAMPPNMKGREGRARLPQISVYGFTHPPLRRKSRELRKSRYISNPPQLQRCVGSEKEKGVFATFVSENKVNVPRVGGVVGFRNSFISPVRS